MDVDPTYSRLLDRLERAVDVIYELAERYALYKGHHAWTHAFDACSAWKKAVGIAYDTADALEEMDRTPSEDDIQRISLVLFHVRELSKITGKLLSDRQVPSIPLHKRQ